MNKKYKYLFKNVGLLTISSFGSRILSFLLLPLYTSVLSTSEYGVYDFLNTTVELLLPILTINIFEAVFRFSVDRNAARKNVFSFGLEVYGIAILALCAFLAVNCRISLIPLLKEYALLFGLLFAVTGIYNLTTQMIRSLDRVPVLAAAGVINTLALCVTNVFFLLHLRLGITGYVWAHILSFLIPTVYMWISARIWSVVLPVPRKLDYSLHRRMRAYSVPLILTNIGWWINSASDRYIVTFFCGVAENGIYSIAYKIPTIVNMFQSIFSQAWLLSAVKSYGEKDKENFYAQVYRLYDTCFILLCSLLICLSRPLAGFLYARAFFKAYLFVPWLLIASLFGALSGFIGCILSAAMDTKSLSLSTIFSAVSNTVLNFLLIPRMGAMGGALATAVSYVIAWFWRLVMIQSKINVKVYNPLSVAAYVILLFQAAATWWTVGRPELLYALQALLFLLNVAVLRKNIFIILNKALSLIKHKMAGN